MTNQQLYIIPTFAFLASMITGLVVIFSIKQDVRDVRVDMNALRAEMTALRLEIKADLHLVTGKLIELLEKR